MWESFEGSARIRAVWAVKALGTDRLGQDGRVEMGWTGHVFFGDILGISQSRQDKYTYVGKYLKEFPGIPGMGYQGFLTRFVRSRQ